MIYIYIYVCKLCLMRREGSGRVNVEKSTAAVIQFPGGWWAGEQHRCWPLNAVSVCGKPSDGEDTDFSGAIKRQRHIGCHV